MTGYKKRYLPSARKVSIDCFPDNKETEPFLDQRVSQMFMQWGQYIDHDLVHTEVNIGGGDCCKDRRGECVHPDSFSGGPCFPITIAPNDRYFNTTCMNFKRSFAVDIDGVYEQINGVTSFIDASSVYGSHKGHEKSLRTMIGGEMKVGEDNTLPRHGDFKCVKNPRHNNMCPIAGDLRVNVFGGLTIIHLLFVREHNRIAKKFQDLNSHWTDERIFQETKRIIVGFHQKITYEDYLPPTLGQKAMKFFKLEPGEFKYDPEVNPGIVNEFAVAAFRFGHVMINAFLPMGGKISKISENFFRPGKAMDNYRSIKKIIKFQCQRKAQKFDHHMTRQVTDLLFKDVDGEGVSTDLAARNIQRGRDHGVLAYLDYFNLAMRGFVRHVHNFTYRPALPECLKKLNYDVIEDIDLFVGGVYEQPIDDGIVGPTFSYILADQFWRLKVGDRFFYETDDPQIGFTASQLREIRKQSLTHLFCRNTEIKSMQPDALLMESRTNKKQPCRLYEDIDLSYWKESPSPTDAPQQAEASPTMTSELNDFMNSI